MRFRKGGLLGTWVAQSVKRLISARVMISQSASSSPTSGSVLTAQSLEPALDSVSPSLSAPPLLMLCLSLSQKLKKKKFKKVHYRKEGLLKENATNHLKICISLLGLP